METYTLALLWALGSYIVYSVVVRFITDRRHAASAKSLGCQPLPVFPNKYPFGIEHVYAAIETDQRKVFPEYVLARNAAMNHRTHEYHILGNVGVVTNDPENLKAILATQFHDFDLGPRRRGNFFPLLGNGIFTADGKMWEHSRSMMRPQFARDQVSDLSLEEEHVQNMMRALPVSSSGWTQPIDLSVLFFRLTLDSACEFLFGESVDSQILNLPSNLANPSPSSKGIGGDTATLDEKGFAAAFDNGQKKLGRRARFMNFYYLSDGPTFRKQCRDVHSFVDYFVSIALSKSAPTEKQLEAGISFPSSLGKKDKYVFLDALAAQTRDPIELRSQLLNILLAGRDTTASLLGWTFYELCRHPEIYAKLRAAVRADFGSYAESSPTATDPAHAITFAKLKSCIYLQHVLAESLRIHPVVPFNFRNVARDCTLPRGGGPDGTAKVYLRKGQQIEYSVHVMHRLKSLWGVDADEFKPDRWVGRKPGWEYLPFNGGPRICLGQQFALTEASYVTARICQRFDALENLDNGPLRHNLTLTSSPGDGVKVRLREGL